MCHARWSLGRRGQNPAQTSKIAQGDLGDPACQESTKTGGTQCVAGAKLRSMGQNRTSVFVLEEARKPNKN